MPRALKLASVWRRIESTVAAILHQHAIFWIFHFEPDGDGTGGGGWCARQQRFIAPAFPIPSQKWCKNFPEGSPVAK
jgi:hypothetical protein